MPDGPKGFEGDPDYIFFTFNTCQAKQLSIVTFADTTASIGKKWKCDGQKNRRTDITVIWIFINDLMKILPVYFVFRHHVLNLNNILINLSRVTDNQL